MTTDIARRIRALLDKAEHTDFVHERDAFTAKAMALMAEYRITEAMVDAVRDPQERRGRIGDREIQLGSGPYVRARLSLLGPIAEANSCTVVTYVGWEGRVAVLHGYEADLARVEMLYTSLLVQATSAASRVQVPRGAKTVSVRRSFLFGFSAKVGQRLADANAAAARAAESDASARPDGAHGDDRVSVALVLADRRADVDDYVQQRYGRLGTLRAPRVSATGYHQGEAAGARADLTSRRDVRPAARGTLGS